MQEISQALARPQTLYRPLLPLTMSGLVGLSLLALFYVFPALDLTVSAWFFQPAPCLRQASALICGKFPFSSNSMLIGLRMALFYLPHLSALIVLGLVVWMQWSGPKPSLPFIRKGWIALFALLIGPALLVNGLLKTVSGRPRPYDTLAFGGDLPFVPAGDFTGACMQNCSFLSGEASGMGWLLCMIALVPQGKRHLIAPPVVLLSILGAVLRVMFGGHYLSDVLLGWLSSLFVFFLLIVVIGWPKAQKIG